MPTIPIHGKQPGLENSVLPPVPIELMTLGKLLVSFPFIYIRRILMLTFKGLVEL